MVVVLCCAGLNQAGNATAKTAAIATPLKNDFFHVFHV